MVLSNFTTRMLIGLAVLACCSPREARSQAANPPAASPAPVPAVPPEISVSDYFDTWFTRANQAQAEQPHWMTPLVTVTPRLEEEVRYDQYWESRGNGSTLDIFDSGKGWVDAQFLVVKQRLLSANEDNGNYIVSAFLGITAASGNSTFTNQTWLITPTLAAGKGWGDFDIQATTGVAIPFKSQSPLGTAVATNVAFQYHFAKYFWPEFEVNDTYWTNGKERGGKNQVLLTPGIILGRFVIQDRVKFIIGGGYQVAVSPKYVDTSEQTPAYNHAWLLTARVTF
jgi:hypothetical protein